MDQTDYSKKELPELIAELKKTYYGHIADKLTDFPNYLLRKMPDAKFFSSASESLERYGIPDMQEKLEKFKDVITLLFADKPLNEADGATLGNFDVILNGLIRDIKRIGGAAAQIQNPNTMAAKHARTLAGSTRDEPLSEDIRGPLIDAQFGLNREIDQLEDAKLLLAALCDKLNIKRRGANERK